MNRYIALIVAFLFNSKFLFSSDNKLIYTYTLQSEVTPGMARTFSKAMQAAEEKNAALFLIHMNTYGGMLDAADSIRNTIINAKIPVVVFIDRNAASAGALISIACNRIYMRSGSSFGAATVVTQDGSAAPDKYQSYMRAMMRTTAEKRGRDPLIAEAMVDPRIIIAGVNDSGRVLTFTAVEALANNYCNAIVESETEILQKENMTGYTQEYFKPSLTDKLIGFFMSPVISGLLIMIMLAGLYFEFQAPGSIFPIAAAVVAAVFYFAPLYLEGLAANWEILLFAIGVILLAAEFFVIPGFGIAGVIGITCTTLSFALSLLNNKGWDFTFTTPGQITNAVAISCGAMLVSVVMVFYLLSKLATSNRFGRMTLQTQFNSSDGFSIAEGKTSLKGKRGTAFTQLRPSGKVIIDAKVYDAVAQSGVIEINSSIEVVEHSLTLTVRKTD